jgi:hypothetical protein
MVSEIGYVMEVNYLATKWITDWCVENNKKIAEINNEGAPIKFQINSEDLLK